MIGHDSQLTSLQAARLCKFVGPFQTENFYYEIPGHCLDLNVMVTVRVIVRRAKLDYSQIPFRNFA